MKFKTKKKYPFRILIDDAHGFRTMAHADGVAEHYGVTDEIDVIFYAFAKSMASIGGVVCSEPEIIDHLKCNMRSQIFAKSLPVALVVGTRSVLTSSKHIPNTANICGRLSMPCRTVSVPKASTWALRNRLSLRFTSRAA